ncbi:hypothetical protein EW026_g8008 [Hermanssonia centrifuga]|uniref:Uncharacterized protein n=1 Tax=Hermanssonia centrifuga TaxID=98765 RepID=A0A4S4K5Y3_9APHY|nr:hypothetical protein EW026_g8008 [Hermanssonia centrifuga]
MQHYTAYLHVRDPSEINANPQNNALSELPDVHESDDRTCFGAQAAFIRLPWSSMQSRALGGKFKYIFSLLPGQKLFMKEYQRMKSMLSKSILMVLGVAMIVSGTPVPQDGTPEVSYATFTGTKVYNTIVSYSPWLTEATSVFTWVQTRTIEPTPTP